MWQPRTWLLQMLQKRCFSRPPMMIAPWRLPRLQRDWQLRLMWHYNNWCLLRTGSGSNDGWCILPLLGPKLTLEPLDCFFQVPGKCTGRILVSLQELARDVAAKGLAAAAEVAYHSLGRREFEAEEAHSTAAAVAAVGVAAATEVAVRRLSQDAGIHRWCCRKW